VRRIIVSMRAITAGLRSASPSLDQRRTVEATTASIPPCRTSAARACQAAVKSAVVVWRESAMMALLTRAG